MIIFAGTLLDMVFNATQMYENTSGLLITNAATQEPVTNKNIYCVWFEFLLGSCFSYSLIFFGFIGNILSIWTMWDERHTSPTSFLLIILGFTDNLVLVSAGGMHATLS